MGFQVYDTLTRAKRPFTVLEPGLVRMYNCGPTVYSRPHIGNLRTFLFADTLRRWLEYRGYEVRQVMNITDVGHVQADADEGEDKIEAQARREQADPWEISRRIAAQFLRDVEELSLRPALCYPRATEHVQEMLDMIDGLVAKGYAYAVGGNVYFEVSRFPSYGRLSGNRVEDLVAGARVEVNEEKRHPADFALWKSDPRHVMKWGSRWGPDGFPGWHIECSAMAKKHLGERIDIHTGGEDNVFPHHECEIAQSEAFTGKPFATYWMHSKFLQVDGGKMSKSLGNVYSLDDVKARGFSARALRFALIRGHYRAPLNFTWAALQDASSALESLDDLVQRLRRAVAEGGPARGGEHVEEARAQLERALDDDLNVPEALPPLFGLRARALEGAFAGQGAQRALELLARANSALGVIDVAERSIDAHVRERIERREAARGRKDFAEADRIRADLLREGILLEDTAKGVVWRRK